MDTIRIGTSAAALLPTAPVRAAVCADRQSRAAVAFDQSQSLR
jgi:hypothetical protein